MFFCFASEAQSSYTYSSSSQQPWCSATKNKDLLSKIGVHALSPLMSRWNLRRKSHFQNSHTGASTHLFPTTRLARATPLPIERGSRTKLLVMDSGSGTLYLCFVSQLDELSRSFWNKAWSPLRTCLVLSISVAINWLKKLWITDYHTRIWCCVRRKNSGETVWWTQRSWLRLLLQEVLDVLRRQSIAPYWLWTESGDLYWCTVGTFGFICLPIE